MVTSWAALPFREPLAMEEGAVDEEVVDVLLPRWVRAMWNEERIGIRNGWSIPKLVS